MRPALLALAAGLLTGCAHFDVPWNDTWEKAQWKKQEDDFRAKHPQVVYSQKSNWELENEVREEYSKNILPTWIGHSTEELRQDEFAGKLIQEVTRSASGNYQFEKWDCVLFWLYFTNGKLDSYQITARR